MATATTDLGGASRITEMCRFYLRAPESCSESAGIITFNFNPALSAPEQATFDRLVKVATSAVPGITPAEWAAIQSDIDGLVTFQNLATPTLPQAVLAIKAQSRILRALLRS